MKSVIIHTLNAIVWIVLILAICTLIFGRF